MSDTSVSSEGLTSSMTGKESKRVLLSIVDVREKV
jgi:hypothetical protein